MTKTRWHAARLIGLLLLCGCQAQARRLLLLDLALSDPALLNGTVRPWHDEGYTVEYRRFYPHLARTDLERYRVLLFLLGREPEAPSDALTAGDLALLTEWVIRGGDGLVVVISRHALGALGPQFRSTTAPAQQLDALDRTREFLGAVARWTRRPAEWAHVPPAARGGPLSLAQAPVPVELSPPLMSPPTGVDTIALPLRPDPKLARPTSPPEWLRQQGMRVLWTPLFATRDGRRAVRSGASLDSLVALLDAGGFNLLAGDAGPESSDSLHTYWEERLAVRRAWADAVKRLQPTSVAWIPLLDYGN